MAGRQASRLRLIFERRRLARLETALGLLAWQQADYDSVTQEHVDRLTDYERAQARIANESAAIGLEIQQLEAQRGVAEREFEEASSAALEKEYPAVTHAETLEAAVVAKRKERREIEARLPVFDRELREAEEEYRALVAREQPSSEVKSQLFRWRKVILALPQEKAEWTARLQQVTQELTAMEALLASLQEARERFEERDQELADDIAAHQRARRKVEKQVEALEKAKSEPHREIGRALADHNIGPLNQPEALDAVLAQREKIAGIEESIRASFALSAAQGGGKR
jgi:chromosome segregation ATPase